MSRTEIIVLLILLVMLLILTVVWWWARRLKQDLDTDPAVIVGARGEIELSPASLARLRQLSAEPVLLKQSEEGVRVQIENKPMVPLVAFVGKDVSAALREAAMRVSERYGPKWVVLVSAHEDGRVTLQRLG
jgi:hypothetical protein